MSQKRGYEAFVSMILFVVLNFQKCCGFNDCYWLSSMEEICFVFNKSQLTFEESKQYCQNNGGFLLEIHDNKIQILVETFLKSKSIYVGEAWLNLVRTNWNLWVWRGEESVLGNYLTYSNWDIKNPSSDGINRAFMISAFTWVNAYDPETATTICMKETTRTPETTSLSSSAAIGIGVGVGLGGLVLIIVSSLLIAKFVFRKEIPLPFKSSRSIKSPPHETGSDVGKEDSVYGGYEQIDENKIGFSQNSSGPRAAYAKVTAIPDHHEPPTDYYNNSNNNKKKVLEYADLGNSSL